MAAVKVSDFDYHLPPHLIAQFPLPDRSASRLMTVDRKTGRIGHARFADLTGLLRRGDLLVLNDTRVIPARLRARRSDTGGRVEILLLEEDRDGSWIALWKSSGRPREGMGFELGEGRIAGRIADVCPGGRVKIQFDAPVPVPDILAELGETPLPPYIRRRGGRLSEMDRERYQTVYARNPGAVAAPTAGLHFTRKMLDSLDAAGIAKCWVTLHVGPGTFMPVRSEDVEDHEMESERYRVSPETAAAIAECRRRGGRVVAVGTTVVRTLETAADDAGGVKACEGRTSLFIHPPCRFRVVDALVTNFHLPRSTLLMLVCAFAGMDLVKKAYAEAVAAGYRFYSYGDAMLIC